VSLSSAKPELEENPKWIALAEVLKEIRLEIAVQGEQFPSIKTLIVAEDDRTCDQLRQILESGSKEFLEKIFKKSNSPKNYYEKYESVLNYILLITKQYLIRKIIFFT
jgi:hypothetical protein